MLRLTQGRSVRWIGVVALSACHHGGAPAASPFAQTIPRDAARFEIDAVNDSTASFRPQEARWIRVGMSAYAVNPLKRDALVARLRVQAQTGESMTALVTSQVGRVSTAHFLLIMRPAEPWWRGDRFWWGAAAGTVLGAAATAMAR